MKNFFHLAIVRFNDLTNRFPLFWQFFKFCSVGVTNLVLYLLIFWLMTRQFSWHYLPASIVGFLLTVTLSFFINRKLTFKHDGKDHGRQYITFIIANLISMCVNLALLTLLIEFFKLYDLVAQLVCSFLIAFLNFGLNRFWTFKKRS